MIIHIDLDCFFVSCERIRSLELMNKPVVVCKSSDKSIFSEEDSLKITGQKVGAFSSIIKNKVEHKPFDKNAWKSEFIENGRIHGIVIAKSYEAKKYDIKTGTTLSDALKMCPNLLVLKSDIYFYELLSVELKEFLQSKIPLLEQYSIDEFWGDLSGFIKEENTYSFIKKLQEQILEKFGLPVSIGASNSKWIAKLATDFNKPYGLKLVPKDEVFDFVSPLLVETFPGIGKALQKKLASYKIKTLGELVKAKVLLDGWGVAGKELYKKITGTDNELVDDKRDRRSIGISRNFQPTKDKEEIKRKAIILSRHLSHEIAQLNLTPTTFMFELRYEGYLKSRHSKTIDRNFSENILKELTIESMKSLDIHKDIKIMHIAIYATNFKQKTTNKTLSLFNIEEDEKFKNLFEKVSKLREKYGIDIIRSGVEKIKK